MKQFEYFHLNYRKLEDDMFEDYRYLSSYIEDYDELSTTEKSSLKFFENILKIIIEKVKMVF